LAGIASLQEIETHWSLPDLLDANDALDIKEDAEKESVKKLNKNRGK
jgi:hypothetical protein